MRRLFNLAVPLLLLLSFQNVLVLAHVEEEARDVNSRTTPPSNITNLTPEYFSTYGSKRVQITYGPFTAPSSTKDNGMQSFRARNVTRPCSDCLITWVQAGLVYPNGTYANSNTGMWLHHVVLTNTGKTSATCGKEYGGDRFFASGNERTPVSISANGTVQAGYYIGPNDEFTFLVELMNESEDPRDAVVTITYEYIPGVPQSFTQVTPIWLDINSDCSSDSEEPAFNNTAFNYTMQPRWKADFEGHVTCIVGHLHDGGTHLEVLKNGKLVCDCVAAYGQTPGYVETAMDMNNSMSMNMSSMDMVHISSLNSCLDTGTSTVGDEWGLKAFYNTSEFAPMVDSDGSLAGIMGISLVYITQGNNVTTSNSTTANASTSVSSSVSSSVSVTATGSAAGTASATTAANAVAEMIVSRSLLFVGLGIALLI